MSKNNNKFISAVSVTLAIVALQGCASSTLRPVAESSRDTSGSFDGQWIAVVKNTPPTQYGPGNWELTCADRTGQKIGPFVVDNGIASMSAEAQTYVNENGKFRFEIPISTIAASSGTSDSTISNGKMTIIMHGSLKKGAGKMTFGIKEFGNAGCTSKVEYRKV